MSDSDAGVEITDLTGEEETATKRKRSKPEKITAEDKAADKASLKEQRARDKAAKANGLDSAGKKKKGVLFKILIIGIPIILVAAFVAEEIVFNLVGTRNYVGDLFVSAAVWLDPESSGISGELNKREETFNQYKAETETAFEEKQQEVDAKQAELSAREASLDEREAGIASREEQQDRRQETLTAWEKEIDEKEYRLTPAFRRELSDQEVEDMLSLARTYAAMEADTAAVIMAELYNAIDAASILYYMSERNAAAILSVMDVDFAAMVTDILLR